MKRDVTDEGGGAAVLDRASRQTTPAGSHPDQQEMQKRMQAAATPGPAHKSLETLVGDWKAEVKCWQQPGGAPETTRATAKTRWILNSHFLEEEFHGEMMGKPFVGKSIVGYDNIRQMFKMIWLSDVQTSIFVSEGKGEDGNKVITLHGKADCPATNQKDIPMKTVFRVVGPDKHIFEMYDGSKGNAKTMEITYTRA
ncbi:MAG TPA: DUF1579 domain-containing protein [Verrucomicrobiae bacterium]|jgi:hypothetical protein